MTRKMKFRAWDKDRKTFWYSDDEAYLLKEYDGTLWLVEDENFYKSGFKEYQKVSSDLMQFTGLLDKNGKEIYDGDIIHSDTHNENYSICFADGSFIYKIDEGTYNYLFELTTLTIKVVGNIYENPELLEIK